MLVATEKLLKFPSLLISKDGIEPQVGDALGGGPPTRISTKIPTSWAVGSLSLSTEGILYKPVVTT